MSEAVYYFSRWMYVNVIRSTISATIIRCLDNHFALFGVSDGLRTDHGPNLVSKEMENNFEEMGVVHHHSTPHLCGPGPMAKLSVGVCSNNSLATRRGTRNLIYILAFILLNLLTTSTYSTTPLLLLVCTNFY